MPQPDKNRLAMTESRTGRGFELVEFNDYYGKPCSLQQSSLALFEPPGSSAVWLGQGENRMHLDQTQVEELVKRLQHWLETGKIHLGDD